ncbi:MAG: histidine phosphatase family protein [Eubacteriales bacterium]|nr:histidine phosphatase family protein [Eubacteriales bacterium]
MKLYIIRHGETDWNVIGRLQGQTDIPLNENGIRLAGITGQALSQIPFDFAISSPLKRALQTAQLVLEGRNVPIFLDDRIREISFGSWEGLGCRSHNFEIPSDHFDDFFSDPFHFQPAADGETINDLCARTRDFWQDLISRRDWSDKTILIASHGCACRAILNNVYENKQDFWHGHVPPNCAVNIVSVQDGKARLEAEDQVFYDQSEGVDFRTGEHKAKQ